MAVKAGAPTPNEQGKDGMNRQWMIYGAYGYSGELAARDAVRRGLRPVLAGRSAAKLQPLAQELGLEFRAFDIADAATGVRGMHTVLNCAGPFSSTAKPMIRACVDAGAHYVDITGEIPVFETCHELDALAQAKGLVLCPGAGFDVVPTDCLAAMLKERMPDAQTIDLALSFGTRPSIGTARTIVEGAAAGGLVRRDGKLVPVGNAYRIRRIPFAGGARWTATLPWADVFTAGVSTGVPNGMVYTALPLALCWMMKLTSPIRGLFGFAWMQRALDALARRLYGGGPDDNARATQRTQFWGEAIDAAGTRISARLSAPNVYALTADTAVTVSEHCLNGPNRTGFVTPSKLLGSGFITTRPGVRLEA